MTFLLSPSFVAKRNFPAFVRPSCLSCDCYRDRTLPSPNCDKIVEPGGQKLRRCSGQICLSRFLAIASRRYSKGSFFVSDKGTCLCVKFCLLSSPTASSSTLHLMLGS